MYVRYMNGPAYYNIRRLHLRNPSISFTSKVPNYILFLIFRSVSATGNHLAIEQSQLQFKSITELSDLGLIEDPQLTRRVNVDGFVNFRSSRKR